MPLVKPFAGYRYDPTKVDPSLVVAPPYDVIDLELQAMLYSRDPRNIIRLILGREADPYASAAATAQRWIEEGVLIRDREPALYFIEQEFTLPGGGRHRRSGFIAACRLEEFGGSVLPHEKTHSGPKQDRLKLMRATGMMFSQIFALYDDREGLLERVLRQAEATPPAIDVVHDGVVNRLRVCTDAAAIHAVTDFLRTRAVLIADGHHRYETALAYRDERRLRNPGHDGKEPYNFVPMFFTNESAPGTVMLPTHRLLHGIASFDQESFLAAARQYFSIVPEPDTGALLGRLGAGPGGEFGVVFPRGGGAFLLRANGNAARLLEGRPAAAARIDAVLLHEAVFGKLLGLSEASQERKENLEFERDASRALVTLEADPKIQAAFFMKAPPVSHVRSAAEAGETLPQKTTFFFPKLLSGMVTYVLDDRGAG